MERGEPELHTGRWVVSGRVQGVGFRWFVHRNATRLDLVGWVRNLPDGRVEIEASGPRRSLMALEESIAAGPAMAHVENVEKAPASLELIALKLFEIR